MFVRGLEDHRPSISLAFQHTGGEPSASEAVVFCEGRGRSGSGPIHSEKEIERSPLERVADLMRIEPFLLRLRE